MGRAQAMRDLASGPGRSSAASAGIPARRRPAIPVHGTGDAGVACADIRHHAEWWSKLKRTRAEPPLRARLRPGGTWL